MITLLTIGAYVGAITAVCAFGVSMWKYVIKPAIKFIRHTYEAFEKLDRINTELLPNGGKSIKDAVVRIEGRLSFLEASYYASLVLNDEGLFEADKNGLMVWFCSKLCTMLGHSREELLQNNWINIIAAEEQDKIYVSWMKAVEQERDYTMSANIITDHGVIKKVKFWAIPLKDLKSGEILGYRGRITDETHY